MDECVELVGKFEIDLQPTFIFFKNEEKVQQWSGSNSTKLEEIIKELVNQRSAIAQLNFDKNKM